MCRTQCVLALATLYLGLVHSWDIAVSLGNQLEFYTDGIKTDTVHLKLHNITTITYDEVHNMILFVDKRRDNDAICGYHLISKNVSCFVQRYGSDIHDLAFDPATDLLFFTDKKVKSINWISLKYPGSENNVYGNSLITMFDRTPSDIQVDSCKGLIYWTNTEQRRYGRSYMERARLNGSEIYVVENKKPINNFAIDLQTKKTFFFTGSHFDLLKKVDLKVTKWSKKEDIMYYNKPRSCEELTVSKDYLYWTQSSASNKTIWQKLKNSTKVKVEHKVMYRFHTEHKLGIAANYRIKDQVHGLQDCEALARLIPLLETEQTTEQTTELVWSTESTETSSSGSTTELDWPTGSIETSSLRPELYSSTENTETSSWRPEPELSIETEQISVSTTEQVWSTESTETSSSGSTTELDWPTGSIETSSLRPELYLSTENTETSSWRPELELSTETEQVSVSTTEQVWSTESTEKSSSGSTTELDWPTGSIETSSLRPELYSSTENTDKSSDTTENTETSSWRPELELSTETELVSVSTTELDPIWSTDTEPTEQTSELNEIVETKLNEVVGSKKQMFLDENGELDRTTKPDETSKVEVHACHGYCLNNGNCSLTKKSEPVCHCKGDYVGDRCEVSGCHNYCFQGSCSLNDEGHPKCRCNAGYSGARCEVYACQGFCLNSGVCSLNKQEKPVCQCVGNYEGIKCEAVKKNIFSYTPQIYSENRNLTLADLVSNWRKPAVKVSVVVEV